MQQKIYSRINQLKDYTLPFQEEFKIIDFVMEKGSNEPIAKVVDKINYKKLSQTYAGQTDLELIKKIAKQKNPKDKLEQANYVATHLDPVNQGITLPEEISANSPIEAIMQQKSLAEQTEAYLNRLPPELASYIKENATGTINIEEFIKKTYPIEEKSNG